MDAGRSFPQEASCPSHPGCVRLRLLELFVLLGLPAPSAPALLRTHPRSRFALAFGLAAPMDVVSAGCARDVLAFAPAERAKR